MHPREAMARQEAGELDGLGLLRALITWSPWLVPAAIGPGGPSPLLDVVERARWYPACADAAALQTWASATGRELDLWLELAGTAVFGGLTDDLDGINVDPHAAHAVHYRRHQFPRLREMAQAVEVHRILHGQEAPDAFQKLASYDGYRLVFRGDALALAPDDAGRRLAAVFTAEDTVARFLETVDLQLPVVRRVRGDELFRRLVEIPLDGIVFDCRGPVAAKALAPSFAQVVLDRTRP